MSDTPRRYRWTHVPTGTTGIRAFDFTTTYIGNRMFTPNARRLDALALIDRWNTQQPNEWQYALVEDERA